MSPPPGTVDLWSLRAGPGNVAAARSEASVLDASEAQRAESLGPPAVRDTYLVAHVRLRQILGRRLGLPPAEVAFAREECPRCGGRHGRPVLAGERDLGAGVHFSLSHSGDRILIAVAGSPVGVDVEAVGRKPRSGLLRRLHPEERAAVSALPPGRREEAVLTCWVRKEAYLKGIGAGLAAGLDRTYVGTGPVFGGTEPTPAALGDWWLTAAPVPPGHVGAVALRRPAGLLPLPARIRLRP
ncbi:4'-phosphopantetheinyl transferase superfamily protein [Streptomyces sp. NPDC091371]|uniref:4'-phosphopantetheinyl transferase family protein n=1 Tax=Streptomyces sp. NPDC091371 TaxID=3155303 RepID=UPI00342B58FC